jgi:hypothetical protein
MRQWRTQIVDRRWPERHPVVLGLTISGTLLLGLVAQEILLNRFALMRADPDVAKVFRIAISHCLMAGYFPAAYYALLRGTRETVRELGETLDPTDADWRVDSAVQITKRTLLICCTVGLVASVAMPYLSSETPPWNPSYWAPEVWWHRLLGVIAAVWVGFFFAAVIDTAAQTLRLADWIDVMDLLDLSVWAPFVKQGLLTSLLVIGGLTVQAIRLFEPQERTILAITFGLTLPLALLGLWLPVRGAHRRIRQAKEAELARISERIQQARTLLLEGAADGLAGISPDQMPSLIAYLQLVESIPDWPFRASTAVQLVLYLLIPVASWFGKKLIEGLLDRFLR